MAYLALYRTYRPSKFSDVVGQDHIVTVLKNQIIKARVGHAYIFSGPRGTGKTSVAKVFARSLNCLNPNGVEPCLKCDICLGIENDTCIDVVEIDAASNNGVENIRDIREKASLLPAVGKYKIYIIDEVHMLSLGAFNALLKILEEPPSHVIFILATTEPKKILATILSRCQRYDFKRLSTSDIVGQLKYVATNQGVKASEDALLLIARTAMGSMRDALSILDQCISISDTIEASDILSIIGGASRSEIIVLVGYITSYDEKNAIIKLEQIKDSGADIKILLKDLAYIFKGMLYISKGISHDVAGVLEGEADQLKAMANTFGQNALLRGMDILISSESLLRTNSLPEIILQTALIKVMSPNIDESASDLSRIERIEASLENLKKNGISIKTSVEKKTNEANKKQSDGDRKKDERAPDEVKSAEAKSAKKIYNVSGDVNQNWDKILTMLHKQFVALYPHARKLKLMGSENDTLFFEIDSEMSQGVLMEKSNMAKIRHCAENVFDKKIIVNIESHDKKSVGTGQTDLFPADMFGDIEIKEI